MLILILLLLAYPISIVTTGCVHDIYWRNYIRGEIPCDAFQAAPGKYIGQFHFKESDLIGTIYTESGIAVGQYGTKVSVDKDIRILCSPDNSRLYWDYVDLDKPQEQQFQDAVKGGFYDTKHDPLLIGKIICEGEWRIGKVLGYEYTDIRALWVWDKNQKLVKFSQFFILKYNVTDGCSRQCSNYSLR